MQEDEMPDGMREFAAMMKEADDGETMMMLAFQAMINKFKLAEEGQER